MTAFRVRAMTGFTFPRMVTSFPGPGIWGVKQASGQRRSSLSKVALVERPRLLVRGFYQVNVQQVFSSLGN
jgi:hypothetical protein